MGVWACTHVCVCACAATHLRTDLPAWLAAGKPLGACFRAQVCYSLCPRACGCASLGAGGGGFLGETCCSPTSSRAAAAGAAFPADAGCIKCRWTLAATFRSDGSRHNATCHMLRPWGIRPTPSRWTVSELNAPNSSCASVRACVRARVSFLRGSCCHGAYQWGGATNGRWACDDTRGTDAGQRGYVWCGSESQSFAERWAPGDVISCSLDLDRSSAAPAARSARACTAGCPCAVSCVSGVNRP